ncbi:unnamed protein product, partial [Iphiclides podalirius]
MNGLACPQKFHGCPEYLAQVGFAPLDDQSRDERPAFSASITRSTSIFLGEEVREYAKFVQAKSWDEERRARDVPIVCIYGRYVRS